MRHMTVQQKVGQLFVIEVAGRDANNVSEAAKRVNQTLYGVDTPAQAIAKYQPGGVIYYTTRSPAPAAPATTTSAIPPRSPPCPTGSRPRRWRSPPTSRCRSRWTRRGARSSPASSLRRPDARQHGARRGTVARDACDSAKVIGEELQSVGVTQDYAPDSDVNINPNNPVIGIRSIGGDPGLVSDLASTQVKGFHAGGISAVAKHFPGHGDTGVDSHFGLPQVTHTREQFEAIDLPPFRADIAAGVDTIMTAHVVFPAVDPSERPRR